MSEITEIKPTPSIKKLLEAQAELNKAQTKAKEEYTATVKAESEKAISDFAHALSKVSALYQLAKDVEVEGTTLAGQFYRNDTVIGLLKALRLVTDDEHDAKVSRALAKAAARAKPIAFNAVKIGKKHRMSMEEKTKLITQVLKTEKELSTSELEKKTGINQINKDLTKLKGKVLTRSGKGGKQGYTWSLK